MDKKINVTKIDTAWSTCEYEFRVFVEEYEIGKHNYILETLKKWFGAAEYFWDNMFLCGLKVR